MSSVREQIMNLAEQHGISVSVPADKSELWAEAISRLSDNDVPQDQTRRALVRLRRMGAISQEDGHAWLIKLYFEQDATSAQATDR